MVKLGVQLIPELAPTGVKRVEKNIHIHGVMGLGIPTHFCIMPDLNVCNKLFGINIHILIKGS